MREDRPRVRIEDLVTRAAARFPDRPALVTPAGGVEYTHAELAHTVSTLAGKLRLDGISPDDRIVVLGDHQPGTVIAILACLQAGAVYVPLDPRWPVERLRSACDQVDAQALLCSPALARLAEQVLPTRLIRTVDDEPLEPDPNAPPPMTLDPDAAAYCMFTSGTTGRPKGVLVRHPAVIDLLEWIDRDFGVGPDDRLLMVNAFAFDLSVWDIVGMLAAGGSLLLVSDAERADPDIVVRLLSVTSITLWNSAPSAMLQILAAAGAGVVGRSLRRVLLSGDWIPLTLPDRIRAAFPSAEVISLGGATEATVWSNAYLVGVVDPTWPSIPYGRPMPGVRYHVLDVALRPVPDGVEGELFIGGPCLADGYVGEPALTASRFLPEPGGHGRMYRTGDLVRLLPDGNVEIRGRIDSQLKIRGYRVEAAEVEATLLRSSGVREAAAVAVGAAGERELVAVVAGEVDPDRLRREAAAILPSYLVPSRVIVVAELPMTLNGKLDRPHLARLAARATLPEGVS